MLSPNSAFAVICGQMMHEVVRRQDPLYPLCWADAGVGEVSALLGGRGSTGPRYMTCP